MRYITERELRDSFCNGTPEHYDVPSDAKLTPAARQYLIDLKLYRHQAVPFATLGASTKRMGLNETSTGENTSGISAPNVTKRFALEHGAPVSEKPEHMTHLSRTQLVCKADPRIELRGRLDSLEADVLIAQLDAPKSFITPLEDALSLIRQAVACDVRNEPMPDWTLDGMTAEQVHRASHHPEELGYTGHPMPNVSQGRFALVLNRLRTQSRECELCAVRAYWNDGALEHGDVVLALNRLSSFFYVLQLRAAVKK